MANRKGAEEYILKYIHKIDPSGKNRDIYKEMFKNMSNKEFNTFMTGLKDKKINLAIIAPNWLNLLNIDRNLKLAKELKIDFFTKLIKGNSKDDTLFKPNIDYMVLRLPYKRASQSLIKKISIPEDNHSVDMLSGQVTNKSKGAKLTMPEIQLLNSMGLKDSVIELLKYRGGDIKGQKAMDAIISRYGEVSQDMLEAYAGGVVSTQTFKTFLQAMHIKSTL